jgi:sugar lactone lactonase YvrE
MTSRRDADVELLGTAGRDVLGEGPWWDARHQRLLWVDIKRRLVRQATLDGVEEAPLPTPSDVGFAVRDDQDGLVAGLRDGLHRHADGRWSPLWTETPDTSSHRVNDGKTDRAGRLWFGTMHDAETEATSALYRFADGRCEQQLDAVTTSNGLGWSPDDRSFYYTDSMARRIWVFDFDPASGRLSNRRVFAEDPAGYVPDGLTVDVDGAVWAAKWDGAKVVRYRPDGSVDLELTFPVRRPTSVAFVGADLSTLAVTSADAGLGPQEPLAGRVFLVPTSTQGRPETPARA